jgi:hypothetical protein
MTIPVAPNTPFVERRRTPRVAPTDLTFGVPIVREAEVLDLSVSGALVSMSAPISVGQRLQLRLLLGREPFQAWVEVRRIDHGTVTGRANRVRAGVTFTSLDENSQRTLERFLREKAPGVN